MINQSGTRIKHTLSVLLIDDALDQIELMSVMINNLKGYHCRLFKTTNAKDCKEIITNNQIDLVITDYLMPEFTGMDVLREVKSLNPKIDVVIMTAYADITNAVDIMKQQAFDYLVKPVKLEVLDSLFCRVAEGKAVVEETNQLKDLVIEHNEEQRVILSNSSVMDEVLSIASRSAQSDATVLLRGESGTGKELIAKSIHRLSLRKDKAFITVNLAALPHSLVESELFGHKQGSFTGANQDRKGRFEEANGGTLFIDEVGDIPPETQVKILRALQFGEFERLGDNKSIKTDVRIIAATNRNLEEMILQGLFRADLFYRINVISISIPSLRERKQDILLLIDHCINKFSKKNKKNINGISDDSIDKLIKYNYPGNVRELENIIERAIVLCRGDYITQQDIFLPSFDYEPKNLDSDILNPYNLKDSYTKKVNFFEKKIIEYALSLSSGNKSAAARMLQITERRLRSRLERIDANQQDSADLN